MSRKVPSRLRAKSRYWRNAKDDNENNQGAQMRRNDNVLEKLKKHAEAKKNCMFLIIQGRVAIVIYLQ
jgi:hypothetical protein